MNDWINADYDFGMPMKGVIVSGNFFRNSGLMKIYEMFRDPEKARLFVKMEPLFEALPTDVILVRISLPINQDAVIFYFVSKEFEPLKGLNVMTITPLESLKESKAQ